MKDKAKRIEVKITFGLPLTEQEMAYYMLFYSTTFNKEKEFEK